MESIWLGLVHHRHGINTYAGRTREALNEELYEYIVENWDELNGAEDFPKNPPENAEEAIQLYFNEGMEYHREYVDIVEVGVRE